MAKKIGNDGLRVAYDYGKMEVVFIVVDPKGNEKTRSAPFVWSEVSDENKPKVVLYGFNKVLTDRTSDVKANPAEKLRGMQEVYQLLQTEEWRKERIAGAPTVSPEVEAVARIKKISIPMAQKALGKLTKEQREKVLGAKSVTDLAEKIATERLQAKEVDLSDLA
jgi:hypothetical protein